MATRGRPRQFDRDDALHRAMDVFWAKGYEGAQLIDLTRAMGINPPSFYAAFGNKEAVFREALTLYLQQTGSRSIKALESERTAREGVAAMLALSIENAYAAPNHGGCLLVVGLVNCHPENEALRDHVRDLRRMTIDSVRRRLERGVREGDLPPDTEIDRLAIFYATVVLGLSLQARDGASREDLEAVAASALAALPATR